MRWIVAALLSAGCESMLGPSAHTCGPVMPEFPDGYTCPNGFACSAAPEYCGAPNAIIDACSGHDEHDTCKTDSIAAGVCLTQLDPATNTMQRECTECSADIAWCKVTGWNGMTVLHGYKFTSLWVAGVGEAYIGTEVGTDGVALLQYDGMTWNKFPTQPTIPAFNQVWSIWTSGKDLYLAAGTQVWHYDGTSWNDLLPGLPPATSIHAIWGAGGTLFGAGGGGLVTYYDGTWHNSTSTTGMSGWGPPKYSSVWSNGSEAYAVGGATDATSQTEGAFAHFSGGSWNATAIAYPSAVLQSVWGSSTAYAVGDANPYVTAVELMPTGATSLPNTMALAPASLATIWGAAPADIYVGGVRGTVLHFDGTSTWANAGPVPTLPDLVQLSGTGPNDIYAMSADGVWRYGPN
jgi:hypothetical protein